MATCLVLSDKELKAYNNLGVSKYEVQRDYLEYGKLRSPMAISYKIKKRDVEIPGLRNLAENQYEEFISEAESFDNTSAEGWQFKLSKALGVNTEIVTRDQAREIHAAKEYDYQNEDAFFTDGVVYFVEGTLTTESVVHEFSHPLIKSLDPAIKAKLFLDLLADPKLEGQAIVDEVIEQYGETLNEDRFQEEVLVRALTKMTAQQTETPKIDTWLGKFLYQIKQALRKLIGKKVNVSKLDGNTTLNNLAEMLAKGDVVELQEDIITQADVIEHFKNRKEFVENFDELLSQDNIEGRAIAQMMINQTVDTAISQKNDVVNNPDFFPIREALLLEFGENNRGLLDEIIQTLSKDATLDRKKVTESIVGHEDYVPTMEVVRERLLNLSTSLHKVDEIFDTMLNFNEENNPIGGGQLSELEGLDSKDKIDRLLYYKAFMLQWVGRYDVNNPTVSSQGIVDTLSQISKRYDVNHPVRKLSEKLSRKSEAILEKIGEMQKDAVKDYMYEIMMPVADQALKQFNDDVIKREKNGASDRVIDRMYQEFHNMTRDQYKRLIALKKQGVKSTPEFKRLEELWLRGNELNHDKIDAIILGRTGDANWSNGMIESLSQNSDPQIGSVYKHMQKIRTNYEAKALGAYAEFIEAVAPHIKETGGEFQTRGSLGQKMGFKDTKGVIRNGEVEKVEEWVFLNEWKGHRYDETVHQNNIQQSALTYRDTNSDKDFKAWKKAERDYQLWKNEYMNQKYDVEYYETMDLLMKDDVGIEAQKRREAIQDELNQFSGDNEDGRYDNVVKNLRVKLRRLSKTTDEFGNKKTGLDLQVAERLTEYSQARAKFFVEDEIPGAFQDAYNDYSNYLVTQGIEDGTDAHDEKMNEWLEKNTRVVLKNSVYERRAELLEEKTKLLELLNAENKKIYDDVEEHTVINEQTNAVKDPTNQPDGNLSTSESRNKVKKAHEKIEEIRKDLINRSGLSNKDNSRLRELRTLYRESGKRWINKEDGVEYDGLMEKKAKNSARLGLNKVTLGRLSEIDAELEAMGGKVPTDHYMETMIDLIRNAGGESSFIDFVKTMDVEIDLMEDAFNDNFVAFINSPAGQELMEKNDDLKKFVDQNHYDREGKLTPTKLWYTAMSNDPYDYKTKRLKDSKGKDKGLIELDGMFRVPSSDFYVRDVKEEYVTKKTDKTVNNKDEFLPKEEKSNRYRNHDYHKLKEQNPGVFDFMETIKEHYLRGQEDAEGNDKMYLSYPRTRKSRLENWRTLNIFRWGRRIREFLRGSEDDIFDMKHEGQRMLKDKDALIVTSSINTNVGAPVIGASENTGMGGRMNIDDISTDILKTIPEYMASVNMKSASKEAQGYARTMQDLVNNTEIDKIDATKLSKKLIGNSYDKNFPDHFKKVTPDKTKRKQVLDAMVEREIDAIYSTGIGSQSVALQKTLAAMTSRSSKINFNWHIFSGIVNWGQMKVTAFTHAVASDDINVIDGAKGEAWAFKVSTKISRDIHRRGHKSLEEQLVLVFDGIPGRAMDTIGDSLSRTYLGDLLDGKVPQKARKWMETQGGLQNFGALMHKKKVKITDKNGNVTEVPYIKAFELVDGRIQTKEGVEEGYALSYAEDGTPKIGEEFVKQKEYMQNVIMKWNGAFSKQDTPLLARNIYAKQLLFLKKHVIPLASKQYAFGLGVNEDGKIKLKKRMNWTTGKADFGYTVQTLRFLRDWIQNWSTGKWLRATKAERVAFMFTAMQIVIGQVVLKAIWKFFTIFGAEGDEDEDKINYKAMKRRSGYYEAPFTVDQEGKDFKAGGYLMNSMSYISRKLMDEYNSVNWFTPQGVVDATKQGTSQSVSAVQTFKYFQDVINMLSGEKNSVPGSTTGAYWFQQKDAVARPFQQVDEEGFITNRGTFFGDMEIGGKWIETLFDFVGQNTKIIDPTNTQKAYEAGKRM